MAVVATGRVKTLTGSGSAQIVAEQIYYTLESGERAYEPYSNCMNFSAYGMITDWPTLGLDSIANLVAFTAYGTATSSGSSSAPYILGYYGRITFLGYEVSYGNQTGSPGGICNWSYSVDMEEVFSYIGPTLPPGSTAGTGENGLPFGTSFASLRPKTGGSYNISLTVGTYTWTLSGTITSEMSEYVIANGGYYASLSCMFYGGTYSPEFPPQITNFQANATAVVDGFSIGYDYQYNAGTLPNYNYSNLFIDFTNGISYQLTSPYGVVYPAGAGGATNIELFQIDALGSILQWIPWDISIQGQAVSAVPGQLPQSFPTTLQAYLSPAVQPYDPVAPTPFSFSPSASLSASYGGAVQLAAGAGGSYDYPQQLVLQYPSQGIIALLNSSDPTTKTEAGPDTRLPFRLPLASGPILSEELRIQLDPCNSISTPGTWTDVTVSGGQLQIDTSAHTTATGVYSTALTSRQGRFLAVEIATPYPSAYSAAQAYSPGYSVGNIVWYDSNAYKCILGTSYPAYNNGTAYVPGTIVNSGGSAYINIAACTGVAPPNGAYWTLVNVSTSNSTYWVQDNTPPSLTIAVTMVKGIVSYSVEAPDYGTTADCIIDMCCCPGYAANDLQSYRYNYPNAPEGPTWGANTISKIAITFPANTGIYGIVEIAIQNESAPFMSTMCSNTGYQSTGTSPYYLPGVIGDVDGRRCLEQPCAAEAEGSYRYYQLSDLHSGLDPGWSYSYTPGSQWYDPSTFGLGAYTAQPFIAWLGGGGATYTKDPSTQDILLNYWIWNQWNQTKQIPVQVMTDAFFGYPNMGDMFSGNGSISGTFVGYICKILRGTFTGLVLSQVPDPISGATVTATESTNVMGTATTDDIGVFKLGGPGSLPGYSGPPAPSYNAGTAYSPGYNPGTVVSTLAYGETTDWVCVLPTSYPNYNPMTAYVPPNKVNYDGAAYHNILACTGEVPTNTTYWLPFDVSPDGVCWEIYPVGDTISSSGGSVIDAALIRENRRVGIGASAPTASWQFQDNQGRIHLAVIHNGDVVYKRADFSNSNQGWSTENTVTSYGDVVSARMVVNPQTGTIVLTIGRLTSGTYNVYWSYSDDDGQTFSTGVLLASNAINIGPWFCDTSASGMTWFVYNSGTSGPGTQQAVYSEGTGQSYGSAFTFKDSTGSAIQVADGGWSNVVEIHDNANAFSWAPILNGSSAPTQLVSYDTGKTWGPP